MCMVYVHVSCICVYDHVICERCITMCTCMVYAVCVPAGIHRQSFNQFEIRKSGECKESSVRAELHPLAQSTRPGQAGNTQFELWTSCLSPMGRAGENMEPPRHSHSCVFGSIINPVVPGHVYINGAGFGSVCFGLEREKWMHGKGAVMQCCCCVGDCWCDSCSTCGSGTELLGQVCFLSRSSRRKREERTRRSRRTRKSTDDKW